MDNDDNDATTSIAPILGLGNTETVSKREPAIIIMSGPTAGQTIKLSGRSLWKVGRSTDSDVVLQDASVSRSHAEFHGKADEWELIDLNSSNGTFVSGERIQRKQLTADDKIQFGSNTILKYVMQDDSEVSLQNELYESATKDALTGLFSKRYFIEQLDVEFNFHRRTKKPLSVVIADLDHFKKVNDTYGCLLYTSPSPRD